MAVTARRATKRRPTRRDKHGRPVPSQPIRDTLMGQLLTSLPEPELKESLEWEPDGRFGQLLSMMADPAYRNHSLTRQCRRAGITLVEMFDHLRRYWMDLGMMRVAQGFPQLMEDVAQDALSKRLPCRQCEGRGELSDEGPSPVKVCSACEGSGEVRVPGDPHSRDLIFEAMGLKGRRKTTKVVIEQTEPLESLEDTLTRAQQVVGGRVKPFQDEH